MVKKISGKPKVKEEEKLIEFLPVFDAIVNIIDEFKMKNAKSQSKM